MRPALQPDLTLEALFDEYSAGVFRFCYRLTGSRSDAEDLTQEVFVAAVTGSGRFEGRSSIRTWLYRIALYRARELRRKNKREVLLDDGVAEPNPCVLSGIVLGRALDDLPPKLKEAFLLVKLEQFTSREAAKLLRLPEGTVKFHVFQAIRLLRAALEGFEHDRPSPTPEKKTYAL